MYQIFDKLFQELKEIVPTEDFACHTIKDGILTPVYKNDTDIIGISKWKEFHGRTNLVINEVGMLKEIKDTKKSISVDNLDKDPRNYACFIAFNIKSIFVLPLIKEDDCIAYIVIPSIGKYYTFTEDVKARCEAIVKSYNYDIVNSGLL